MTQPTAYEFASDQRTIWLKNLPRTPPASDDSTRSIRLHLRPKAHMIIKNLPGLHLHPMIQPTTYDFTLDQRTKEPYDYKKSPRTPLASDDSTHNIRLHLRPKDHIIIKNLPRTPPASDDSTHNIRLHLRPKDHMIIQNLPGLHLHPMTQSTTYDVTLDPRITWL